MKSGGRKSPRTFTTAILMIHPNIKTLKKFNFSIKFLFEVYVDFFLNISDKVLTMTTRLPSMAQERWRSMEEV